MKLADYMSANRLTPDALADVIGEVSASGVRKWMNEERIPRKDQIERIAEITGGAVMPNDFFSLPVAGPDASQAGAGTISEAAE